MTDTPSLAGVWCYPSRPPFHGHKDFMCFDETRRRVVAFVMLGIDGGRHTPVRAWYQSESDKAIATKIRPDGNWYTNVFRQSGDHLLWIDRGVPHVWRLVPLDQYPDWLEERLAQAHARMDKDETAPPRPD